MSESYIPLCDFCTHFHEKEKPMRPFTCDAFPGGIPDDIYFDCADHRHPVDGDHGIQFEKRQDLDQGLIEYFKNIYESNRS